MKHWRIVILFIVILIDALTIILDFLVTTYLPSFAAETCQFDSVDSLLRLIILLVFIFYIVRIGHSNRNKSSLSVLKAVVDDLQHAFETI